MSDSWIPEPQTWPYQCAISKSGDAAQGPYFHSSWLYADHPERGRVGHLMLSRDTVGFILDAPGSPYVRLTKAEYQDLLVAAGRAETTPEPPVAPEPAALNPEPESSPDPIDGVVTSVERTPSVEVSLPQPAAVVLPDDHVRPPVSVIEPEPQPARRGPGRPRKIRE